MASSFPSETCNSYTEDKDPDVLKILMTHFRARARTQACESEMSPLLSPRKRTAGPP